MAQHLPKDALIAAGKWSGESGIPLDDILQAHHAKVARVAAMTRSDAGKYTVLGIDRFDCTDWIQKRYATADEALREARRLTDEAPLSSGASIATVYYAYDPSGNYIGGDTWKGE